MKNYETHGYFTQTSVHEAFSVFRNVTKTFISTVGIYLVVQGCATTVKPVKIDPLADVQSELDATKTSLDQAVASGVNVYSPNNFLNAERSYQNAVEKRGNGDDSESIFKSLGTARAYLDRAQKTSDVIHSGLPNATQARDAAIKADAPQLKADEFKALEKKFISTNSTFEDGDTDNLADEDKEYSKSYVRLETDAIKERLLAAARNNLKQAESEDAQKWAPQTLTQVKSQLDNADKLIEKDRYSGDLPTASEELTAASANLLNITREAKRYSKTDAEALVIQNQKAEQALAAERTSLAQTSQALQRAESREEQLSRSAELERKYDEVAAAFSKDEADVLRQGRLMTIRLKNIQFRSGAAAINPKSFATLKKVHDSLAGFNSPKIRVEGHTDSAGATNLNAKLSLARASAVAKYLSAQGLPETDMEVIGRGEDQPIASNNSVEGRRQNRRVDVVVEPNSKEFPTN